MYKTVPFQETSEREPPHTFFLDEKAPCVWEARGWGAVGVNRKIDSLNYDVNFQVQWWKVTAWGDLSITFGQHLLTALPDLQTDGSSRPSCAVQPPPPGVGLFSLAATKASDVGVAPVGRSCAIAQALGRCAWPRTWRPLLGRCPSAWGPPGFAPDPDVR